MFDDRCVVEWMMDIKNACLYCPPMMSMMKGLGWDLSHMLREWNNAHRTRLMSVPRIHVRRSACEEIVQAHTASDWSIYLCGEYLQNDGMPSKVESSKPVRHHRHLSIADWNSKHTHTFWDISKHWYAHNHTHTYTNNTIEVSLWMVDWKMKPRCRCIAKWIEANTQGRCALS